MEVFSFKDILKPVLVMQKNKRPIQNPVKHLKWNFL